MHPAEVTAVLGDNLGRQGPDNGGLGRVAVFVEPVRLRNAAAIQDAARPASR
jgi:hypothetical protein